MQPWERLMLGCSSWKVLVGRVPKVCTGLEVSCSLEIG